jgi:hypothetical protein
MSNLPNWALGSAVVALLLLGPILTFLVVLGAEMLVDVLTTPEVTPVCIVAAGAICWGIFRAYSPQPRGSQLGSEEARRMGRC